MQLIAPAKVNLYLGIGARRDNGYHDAVSIMHTLELHDIVDVESYPRPEGAGLAVNCSCDTAEDIVPLELAAVDNLAYRAVTMLADAVGRSSDETIDIHLQKHIPAAAGLGGGSSDAAAALIGVCRLWDIDPLDARVVDCARHLGADVPFFLHGACARLDGVGDEWVRDLEPMEGPVVLVKPAEGVSTAAAYRAFDAQPYPVPPAVHEAVLAAGRACDVPLVNNLFPAAETILPALADVRNWLATRPEVVREGDFMQAILCGSGSATCALCNSDADAAAVAEAAREEGWWALPTRFSSSGIHEIEG